MSDVGLNGTWTREVPCTDLGNRERHVKLRINDKNEIVLVVPPGEVGRFTVRQLSQLKVAITELQQELAERGVELR